MKALFLYSRNYWMKILLCLNLFFSFISYSQDTTTFTVKKRFTEVDFFPQIEGVFNGEIDIVKLGSSNGIVTNAGWKIVSFRISYPLGRDYKEVDVQSNVLPEEIVKEIVKGALKEQVFITNIFAVDESKASHLLESMMLIPYLNEE